MTALPAVKLVEMTGQAIYSVQYHSDQ